MSNRPETLVIGIGNEYRGDDAVGLYIARQLTEKAPADCVIIEATGEGVHLINTWEDFSCVIIIDAVRSNSKSGTIHRIDAIEHELPENWVHHSAHTVSLPEAISLARTLNTLPEKLTIYGIEGTRFDPGTELSNEVLQAADRLIPELLEKMRTDQ